MSNWNRETLLPKQHSDTFVHNRTGLWATHVIFLLYSIVCLLLFRWHRRCPINEMNPLKITYLSIISKGRLRRQTLSAVLPRRPSSDKHARRTINELAHCWRDARMCASIRLKTDPHPQSGSTAVCASQRDSRAARRRKKRRTPVACHTRGPSVRRECATPREGAKFQHATTAQTTGREVQNGSP